MKRILRAMTFGSAFLALTGCATLTGGKLVREGEAESQLIIENTSGIDIDVVTISRCSALSYGLNRMGSQVITNNMRMSFRIGAGCWDLMVGHSGSCSRSNDGGQSCSWFQSPGRRFEVGPGETQVVSYGPGA